MTQEQAYNSYCIAWHDAIRRDEFCIDPHEYPEVRQAKKIWLDLGGLPAANFSIDEKKSTNGGRRAEKKVTIAVYEFLENHKKCEFSISQLAKILKINEDSLRLSLVELCDEGVVVRTKFKPDQSIKSPTNYYLFSYVKHKNIEKTEHKNADVVKLKEILKTYGMMDARSLAEKAGFTVSKVRALVINYKFKRRLFKPDKSLNSKNNFYLYMAD